MRRARRESKKGSEATTKLPTRFCNKRREGGLQLRVVAGLHDKDGAADFRCRRFKCAPLISSRRIFWIDQHADDRSDGHDLAHEVESFCVQLAGGEDDASGCVAAWPVNALNQASFYRIAANRKNDWDRGFCRPRCTRRRIASDRHEHVNAALDEFAGQRRQ